MLHLSKEEGKVFFLAVREEYKCLVDGYDPDTGRCPSKKRMRNLKLAESILKKWETTQPVIPGTCFVNLDQLNECQLPLSDKELRYSAALLKNGINGLERELTRYPKPYTGVLKEFEDHISIARTITAKID